LCEPTAVDAFAPRLFCSGIHNRISLSGRRGSGGEIVESQEAQLYIPIAYVSTIRGCECSPHLPPTHLEKPPTQRAPADGEKARAYNKFLSSSEERRLPSPSPRVESIIQFSQLFSFVFGA